MTRLLLLALVLITAACNPAEGKDHMTLFVDLEPLEGGGAASLFGVLVSVDETARSYENTVEITIGGAFVEGVAMDMGMSVLEGLTEVASGSRTSSDDATDAVWTPDFAACDGSAFEVRDDEGCDYAVAVLVGGDRVYSVIMGFTVKSQAPKGEEGTDVEVTIQAEEAQPE